MPLLTTLLAIYNGVTAAVEAKATIDEIRTWIAKDASIESVLAKLVDEQFRDQIPRLAHFCKDGNPLFDKSVFLERLSAADVQATHPTDLKAAMVPIISAAISLPGATCDDSECRSVYEMIADDSISQLWRRIASNAELSRRTLLEQSANTVASTQAVADNVKIIEAKLDAFIEFARASWPRPYDPRLDKAPPRSHQVGPKSIANPFYLARAEDFNHNFDKLARLFQSSPDWDAIQSRTQNVVLEGGRGTGKSMLLRRLTAQACIAAERLKNPQATFDQVPQEYFGVYVKFTRGYYNQFETVDRLPAGGGDLLAQHELNIEVFDAFVSTLLWLEQAHALPNIGASMSDLVSDLSRLFDKAPQCTMLTELLPKVVAFEQGEINNYVTDRALARDSSYKGSAKETVGFLRQLSRIFRQRLFPNREIRMFLLIDEFETLLSVQQKAINSVIKMRLPDVTIKIGVRECGIRTTDTFTPDDPIQDPRDYTPLMLDYDVNLPGYSELLRGIAEKRLADAGFAETAIDKVLPSLPSAEEVDPVDVQKELRAIWDSGRRKETEMTKDFTTKYTLTAMYRVLNRTGRRKQQCGFDQFVLLSSGVVSSFIELCKYAVYFALNDEIDLQQKPVIPPHVQTAAAYEVSQRLLQTIDGNVPRVGEVLKRLIGDVGEIVRQRLLNHPSDTEAIRVGVLDYDRLAELKYASLAEVIDAAVTWSVFQLKSEGASYRSRNRQRPARAELIINRIYAPALEVSPRARMRTDVTVDDLACLINSSTRRETYRRLMKSLGYIKEEGEWLPGLPHSQECKQTHDTRN